MTTSRRFRDLPIDRKLTLLMVGIALVVLLSGLLVLGVGEGIQFVRSAREELRTLAGIIAKNSIAALEFNDAEAATETLASLEARESVVQATLYARDGSVLAHYARSGSSAVPPVPVPPEDGVELASGRFVAFHSVLFHGEGIGRVHLESDLRELVARARRWAGSGALGLILSAGLAFALSARLKRLISGPVLGLVDVVRRVSSDQDYALRARKESEDEIGLLIEGFNDMLAQIQRRDEELQCAHGELELRVEERTKQLQEEIAVRRQAQAELIARAQELQRSNDDLESFAYVASHDLQEPLRAISGFAQLLARRYEAQLDATGQRYVRAVVDGIYRMHELLDGLLAYSRVARDSKPLVPVDLGRTLEVVLRNLAASIGSSGVAIVVDEKSLPTVRADATQMVQLLQNLLSNAIKFRGEEAPRVEIRAERHGPRWRISVADNGIGLDAGYAEKIFAIFQRLHTRKTYPGSGIGLAVCRRIVERHGGQIWVESRPGEGSTFSFTLPAD